MNRVTIQDIARQAGVSKATVSRVLNGTTPVHEDKREAVREAIDRLGFRPNAVARSLAKGRSLTIGVLTQKIGAPFYDAIAQGVILGLGETGYSPIFVDGQWRTDLEVQAIQALVGRRVDGLVLIGGGIPGAQLTELSGDLPTVVVGRNLTDEQHDCIFTDNVEGGYLATQHLIEYGHRDIAIIRGIAEHADAVDRFDGYRRALAEENIELNPALVIDGDFSAESGVAAIDALLAREQEFTAVFAANDTTAFGARLALHRAGLRVPEDVSLVGFDDQAEAAFMVPPLTTIRQPAREMGAEASRALLSLIDGESFESRSLRGELQVRESVATRK